MYLLKIYLGRALVDANSEKSNTQGVMLAYTYRG